MKKLAIFVEGQTEQIFVERLIAEIAGDRDISIEKRQGYGGRDRGRYFVAINSLRRRDMKDYYILLVDSSNDGRVISDIREQYHSLQEAGYDAILGLRDVYPYRYRDLKKLRKNTRANLPKGQIPIRLIFALIEIETWFIAEYSHFRRIDKRLNPRVIQEELGINVLDPKLEEHLGPQTLNLGLSPASHLNMIYKLANKAYSKKRDQVNKVVDALNFDFLFKKVQHRISSLHYFIHELNHFFDS